MFRCRTQQILPGLALFGLLCLPAGAAAMAEKPPVPLPQGVLNAQQITQLFSGNTALATEDGKDRETVLFFGADGQLTSVRDGWQTAGTWEVRNDGRLCVDLEGSRRDCRIIVKEGELYRQYAVKKDGNHRYEQTYGSFMKGRHLAKMSKEPLLPAGTLTKKEVVKLFSGQTVESVTAGKGRASQTYYDPDGTLEQFQGGVKRQGKWRVRDDARMCLQMEDLEEKCRIIVREDGDIRKYIVKKNGEHQHSVSYRKFTPGKTFK